MEKNEDWFAQFRQRSELLLSGLLSGTVDDTCGWGKLLRQLLERPRKEWPGGLLLTGPAGCGRHNTALLTAEYLMEKQDFAALLAEGGGLWEGAADASALRERLNEILDYYYDNGMRDLCLILDPLGGCPYQAELLSFLTETVYEYAAQGEDYPALFLILIAEEGTDIPALLRRSLRICRMSPPSLRQRTEFLERWATDVTDYITISDFAELTEGVTYAQLADAVENVRSLIIWGETEDNIETLSQQVRELIAAQNPQPAAPVWVSQLIGKAEELIERLPSAMAGNAAALPTPVLDSHAAALQSASASASQTGHTREELENMQVKDLLFEAFDRDIAESIQSLTEAE